MLEFPEVHDIHAKDKNNKMPSDLALEHGHENIAQMLEILIRRKKLPPLPTHYLQDLFFPNGIRPQPIKV